MKEIRALCTGLQKIYPYGKEDGCYVLVPIFGDFLEGDGGGYSGEDVQEHFGFEEGKVYRIVVEEVGDERERLKAENERQKKLGEELLNNKDDE